MASRKRMMWTSVAIVATLMIGVPSLSSAQARGAGAGSRRPGSRTRSVAVAAAAAAAARRCTPRQPARRT